LVQQLFFLICHTALQKSLSDLHIPLFVTSHSPRRVIPSYVLSLCDKYGAHALFANIEYEVDELRRDLEICKLALLCGIQVNLLHNKCVIEPGLVVTKQHKAYSVCILSLVDSQSYYLKLSAGVFPISTKLDCDLEWQFAVLSRRLPGPHSERCSCQVVEEILPSF